MGERIKKKRLGVQHYFKGFHTSTLPGSLFHRRAWSSCAARGWSVSPAFGQKRKVPFDSLF